nr:MAG TPA: hypothetical protein [Caudoviricetes sp.]
MFIFFSKKIYPRIWFDLIVAFFDKIIKAVSLDNIFALFLG